MSANSALYVAVTFSQHPFYVRSALVFINYKIVSFSIIFFASLGISPHPLNPGNRNLPLATFCGVRIKYLKSLLAPVSASECLKLSRGGGCWISTTYRYTDAVLMHPGNANLRISMRQEHNSWKGIFGSDFKRYSEHNLWGQQVAFRHMK